MRAPSWGVLKAFLQGHVSACRGALVSTPLFVWTLLGDAQRRERGQMNAATTRRFVKMLFVAILLPLISGCYEISQYYQNGGQERAENMRQQMQQQQSAQMQQQQQQIQQQQMMQQQRQQYYFGPGSSPNRPLYIAPAP